MGKAGFTKNAAGFWEKDGKQLDVYFSYLDFMKAIGPVLQQQLIAAGLQHDLEDRPQVGRAGVPGRPGQLGPRSLQQLRRPIRGVPGLPVEVRDPERHTVHAVVRLQPLEEPGVRHT